MYLVSVPFCLLAAAVLTDAKLPRQVSVTASMAILAFLLVETGIGVPRFKDENAIYQSTFRVDPQNALAHRYYAFALWNNGDYEKAFSEFRIVEELAPRDAFVFAGHAAALAEVGRNDEAAAEFAEALRYSPDHTPFRAFLLYQLAESEVRQHQPAVGEAHLREALQIAPQTLGYHAMLAQALREEGHAQEADTEMSAEANVRRLAAQNYSAR
jgi:tetratricopeptide (TPR) repeat protein